MLQGDEATMRQARRLRSAMSLPEVLLWRALRTRPGRMKFRRQHPSGPFVADFYCHEARLIVEVDGEAHSRGNWPARDAGRDAWFAERGIHVLRIPASLILGDLDSAVRGILAHAHPRLHGKVAAGRADRGISAHPSTLISLHHAGA